MGTDTEAERAIVITRELDAPRELVWLAMTDPQHMVQWWGPTGFTTTVELMDVRPGGVWQYVMHGPDGVDYANRSVFQEVVKPERLTFVHGGSREGGPGAQFDATWTFDALDSGDRTRVTIRMVFASAADRDLIVREYGAIEGGHQTLARLAQHVPAMGLTVREVVLRRIVDAPRAVVFRAWTDPAQLAQWWGPHGFTNPVCEADVRVGGAWHIVMRAPDGTDYPCGGVYREVVEGQRLVFTNVATDTAGKPVLEGLTKAEFSDDGGKTRLTVWTRMTALVPGGVPMLQGMEIGWTQTLERLDERMAAG
jgi:uncharacterized protein YndB with AHSA1/START domain